jgi:hypothetical protein
MAKNLTIELEDKPGILAELGEALGRAGINIEGFCGYASGGTGVVHLLVARQPVARSRVPASACRPSATSWSSRSTTGRVRSA